jgi:uncharacterized membrane protein (UPF0127 family)
MTRNPLTKPPDERLQPRSPTATQVALIAALLALGAALVYPLACRKQAPRPGLLGVDAAREQPKLRTVDVRLGNRNFRLEVADNDDTRAYGLMHRRTMPADHGMIFVFPTERPVTFWMRNTFIPLDVVFVNVQRQVVAIKQGRPLDDRTPLSSGAPASYVIELNQGTAAAAGLKVGDKIDIPAEARRATR